MAKVQLIRWTVVDFPRDIKNKFMGLAKMQGKHTAPLLANIIKAWIYDQEKKDK